MMVAGASEAEMKQPDGVECVDAKDIKIVMKTLSVNTTNDMEKATSQLQYDFLDSSMMKSPSSAASDMPEENRYPQSSIDKPSGPSEKNGKRSKSPIPLTSTGGRPDSSEFDTPSSLVYAQTTTHKGLSNEVGENNCFLNVAIQTLWHLGPFRCEIQKMISSATSPTGRDNDMMEALCNLFTQYEHTELSTIPPTELRKVLSGLFDHCKLGKIADANETLQAMLEKIHMECSPENPCLAHTVFGGLLLEQATCTSCGMTSEPKMRNNFMHYVYASELIRAHTRRISRPPGAGDVQRSRFGGLLHESLGANSRSCPSNDQDHYEGSVTSNPILQKCVDSGSNGLQIETACDGKETNCASHSQRSSPLRSRTLSVTPPVKEDCQSEAEIKVRVVTPPNVLAISVGWTSAKQSIGTLRSFLSLISNTITLSDLCDIAPEKKVNSLFNSPLRSPTMSLSATFAMLSPSRKSPTASPTKRRFLKSSTPRRKSLNSKKWKPVDGDTTGPSYVFRGFVCYYGSHYVSIFQDRSLTGDVQFLLFDDQKVIKLGGWEDVKRECLRSSFQPVLLLYEIENSVAESPRSRDAAAVNRQQEFFEFRSFARNKPRAISPIQVRPSGGVTVSAGLGGGPKKTGKEILRSKSPVAREWVARGAEESNYPMSSPGPPSPNPKPPKSAHERANSLTGYALGEIFNSPCSDSFTSKDYRDSTIKNPLMANPKETLTSRGLKSRDKIQPIEIFKKRLEVKRVILKLNGKMSSGKPRSPQKSVMRALYDFNFPDKNEELNILGIEHSVNKKGHVIVIGFAKHPLKGGKYLAEKSGEIYLEDRIVAIENVPMQNLKKEEVKEIVQGFLDEEWRETLILEVESGKKSCVWYLCPYCSTDNKISDEEALKLKSTRNKIISDHDNLGLKIRLMEEFSTQDPAQRLQIQNENLCGKEHILEYHFMKKLLCHCKTCKFPSSAANLFHDDLLL